MLLPHRNANAITTILLLWCTGSLTAAKPAAFVYVNANIHTVNDRKPKAEAMVVDGQKLVYVGTTAGARKWVGKNTQVVDLQGKTVLPGLIEGHMHLTREGQYQIQVNHFWMPKEQVIAKIQAEATRLPEGTWIVGQGWNQEVWPDRRFPNKADLDAVSPKHPVILTRTDGHAIWVNSKALELAGITNSTPSVEGGIIEKDGQGQVTGILFENAMAMVRKVIPPSAGSASKRPF